MLYELWDGEYRNLVNTFETKAMALEFVRRLINENGEDDISQFFLGSADESGNGGMVAEGRDLIDMALAAETPA